MKDKCCYFLSPSVLRVKCLEATASPESPWSFDGLPPFSLFPLLFLMPSPTIQDCYRESHWKSPCWLKGIPHTYPAAISGAHVIQPGHTHQRSQSTGQCKNKAKKHLLQPTALREGNNCWQNEPKMQI